MSEFIMVEVSNLYYTTQIECEVFFEDNSIICQPLDSDISDWEFYAQWNDKDELVAFNANFPIDA